MKTPFRPVKCSERLPPDTGQTHPFISHTYGWTYGVYALKRHEMIDYIKEHPSHSTVWLEEIPEVTEGEILKVIRGKCISPESAEAAAKAIKSLHENKLK